MTPTPDPWRDALDRWTAGPEDQTQPLDVEGTEPPTHRTFALSRGRIIAAAVVAAILTGAAAAGGALAYLNRRSADEWRDRGVALQDLVGERTKALNRQTARLNVASTTFRKAQTSIKRSEQDVRQLEERQRELANEKAQIEDERAQLLLVANSLDNCNTGLRQVIDVVTSGGDAALLDLNGIAATCDRADSAVRTYLSAFGR